MEYYWGQPDTTVRWCEEKYQISNYVSEFWNTLSNFVYLPLVWYHQKNKILSSYIFLMMCGSFLFHGTSRYLFQILDEVPMLLITNEILFLFHKKTKYTSHPEMKVYVSRSTFFISLLYIISKNYEMFLFVFTVNILCLLFIGWKHKAKSKKYYYLSCGSMLVGKTFWEIEQNFCGYNDYIYLLHSMWHLFSALSLHFIIKYAKS